MIRDLVAHDFHDVVPVRDQADGDGRAEHRELPHGNRRVFLRGLAVHPGVVDDGPRADGIADVVGAVRKTRGARCEDLHERVHMLDFVGVLGCVGVYALHARALGGAVDARLRGVDVVVEAVEKAGDDHGGEADEEGGDVLALVDLASAHGVVVQRAHGPADGAALLAELCVEVCFAFGDEFLVGELLGFVVGGGFLLVDWGDGVGDALLQVVIVAEGGGTDARGGKIVFLDDGIVGNDSLRALRCGRPLQKKGTKGDMVPIKNLLAQRFKIAIPFGCCDDSLCI